MKLFAVSHLFVCLLMAALPSHPPIVEVTRPTPFKEIDFFVSIMVYTLDIGNLSAIFLKNQCLEVISWSE